MGTRDVMTAIGAAVGVVTGEVVLRLVRSEPVLDTKLAVLFVFALAGSFAAAFLVNRARSHRTS